MFLSRPLWLVLRTAKSKKLPIVQLSTAVEGQQEIPDPFRTSEADPKNHNLNHEGKFYNLDSETTGSLFKVAGLNQEFRAQAEAFNETCLMVRRPAVEIIHYLKTANYSHLPIRYVLYSKYVGAGMTMTLAHVIHYAWLQKWLIVDLTNPTTFSFPDRISPWLTQSTFNPTRRDHNKDAVNWLKHFQAQNEHLLPQIKLSRKYIWSKREVSEVGDPLSDVVQHGLNRMAHASDCLAVILKEVKAQSGPNSFRTLVTIDGVNAFFRPCRHKVGHDYLSMDDLTVVRAFKELLSNDWANAAIVVTADMKAHTRDRIPPRWKPVKVYWPDKYPNQVNKPSVWQPLKNDPYLIKKGNFKNLPKPQSTHTRELPHTPWKLLDKEGSNLLDPFVPIEVPKYSRKEFESCLDYYIDRRYIQNEKGRMDEGREELLFLSGCIPRDVYLFCSSV